MSFLHEISKYACVSFNMFYVTVYNECIFTVYGSSCSSMVKVIITLDIIIQTGVSVLLRS